MGESTGSRIAQEESFRSVAVVESQLHESSQDFGIAKALTYMRMLLSAAYHLPCKPYRSKQAGSTAQCRAVLTCETREKVQVQGSLVPRCVPVPRRSKLGVGVPCSSEMT